MKRIAALGSSKSAAGGEKLLGLWPKLDSNARRNALDRLTGSKPGAKAVVAALKDGRISKPDLDGAAFEKLQTVLGPNDPDLAPLVGELTALFRSCASPQLARTMRGLKLIKLWMVHSRSNAGFDWIPASTTTTDTRRSRATGYQFLRCKAARMGWRRD
jgi:hypothetical protein